MSDQLQGKRIEEFAEGVHEGQREPTSRALSQTG